MAETIPYMSTVGNLPDILAKIRSAGAPTKFTHAFFRDTLGFKSSGDRGAIGVLRQLGFLTSDGVPTPRYHAYRGDRSGAALAQGLREGWAPLFLADQSANNLSSTKLTEITKNVTGKGEAVAKKMATTFKALAGLADWDEVVMEPAAEAEVELPDDEQERMERPPAVEGGRSLRLHNDVHVHLPPSTDPAVHAAIFRALREELLD